MLRCLRPFPRLCLGAARSFATHSEASLTPAAFVTALDAAVADEAGGRRSSQNLNTGRTLLQRTLLLPQDGAELPAIDATFAEAVFRAATAFRIDSRRVVSGTAFDHTSRWFATPGRAVEVPASLLAVGLNTMVALHAPLVFDALVAHIDRVIAVAPELDAKALAAIVSAYGRTEVNHDRLYRALAARAKELFAPGTRPTVAQVSNTTYAFARGGHKDPELYAVLAAAGVSVADQVTPLAAATIFEGFAAVGVTDEALFAALERQVTARAAEMTPTLCASLAAAMVDLGRPRSPLIAVCSTRAAAMARSFEPPAIAKLFGALHRADRLDEELLSALAERAVVVAKRFAIRDAATVLRALAHFELFDEELFPLLGARAVFVAQRRGHMSVDSATSLFFAFASVAERHDALFAAVPAMLLNYEQFRRAEPLQALQLLWAATVFPSVVSAPTASQVLVPGLVDIARRATPEDLAAVGPTRYEAVSATFLQEDAVPVARDL